MDTSPLGHGCSILTLHTYLVAIYIAPQQESESDSKTMYYVVHKAENMPDLI